MTKKNYETSDLYEAAALLATKEKLIGLKTERKPYVFVFEDYEVCLSKAMEHTNNELAVLSSDYEQAIKNLKTKVNTL